MSTTTPHMPALQPSTSYSFYPYPVKTIPATSLRGPVPPTQAEAGPSRNRQTERQRATRIRERAEKRALIGQRPAGLAVGRDSEDLDLEEMALDDEGQQINMFGHRFLLPIGRRQTQMELDAAPSPTPSEPDIERRQEDMNNPSPSSPPGGANGQTGDTGDEDADMVDLDGDLEDLDGDLEDLDEESEGELEQEEGSIGDLENDDDSDEI